MEGDDPSLRFSLAYVSDSKRVEDSKRARVRISTLFSSMPSNPSNPMIYAQQIALEIGVRVPINGYYLWDRFFSECTLDVLLDSITVVYKNVPYGSDKLRWISGVQRIFSEEQLAFFISATGGVRRLVDKEFDRNFTSTVVSLSATRYAAVKKELERSLSLLTARPSSNKQAIRAAFDAAETLFRLTFPRSPRLTAGEAKTQLDPVQKSYVKEDRAANSASQKMVAAFMDWIDAAHWYRHAQGTEEPIEPPLGLTVLLISSGVSYVRWLAEIDAELMSNSA